MICICVIQGKLTAKTNNFKLSESNAAKIFFCHTESHEDVPDKQFSWVAFLQALNSVPWVLLLHVSIIKGSDGDHPIWLRVFYGLDL